MKLFEVTNTTWENLQIATHKSVSFTPHIVLICALQFADFLRLCLSPRTTSRTISFSISIVFSINLIPFFDICSVDLLAVFQPGCSGMCYFTWAAARSQQLLFVVLAAGRWHLTAGCHVKSPLFPQPPLKQKCAPRSRWEKATWESIHTTYITSKTVVFFSIQRSPRISTSYKLAAPRYRLPCRLYRWASNLTFQWHGKIAQSCRNHKD